MDTPFSDSLCKIADSMGIALYQRFSSTEAALFLRCPISTVNQLQIEHKIGFVQVTDDQVEFFGYQLLEYILSNVSDVDSGPPENSAPERILRSHEVQKVTGLSRTTLWRLERDGKFPPRVALCPGSVGWRLSEVEEWVKEK